MADEEPRSPLAAKALAQRTKREADAEKASRQKQTHFDRLQGADAHWTRLSGEVADVVREINVELADTGTSLEMKWDEPPLTPNQTGSVNVTVTREGARQNFQVWSLNAFKTGVIRLVDAVSRPQKKKEDILIEKTDRAWVDSSLRSFVDRALD